jgi:hypothetical protein
VEGHDTHAFFWAGSDQPTRSRDDVRRDADKRVALVIGNGNYHKAPVLSNATHDAGAVGALFRVMGFDFVDAKFDLGIADLRSVADIANRCGTIKFDIRSHRQCRRSSRQPQAVDGARDGRGRLSATQGSERLAHQHQGARR